jgi:putative flavoprotein involved in K+ transport
MAAAQRRLVRLLRRIDHDADRLGLAVEPALPAPIQVPETPDLLDLRRAGIRTVLWATGFRRSYTWLNVPVLDQRGEIRHDGGITAEPGLYVLGLQFLRSRKSSFIDGVGADAEALAAHIAAHRASPRQLAA